MIKHAVNIWSCLIRDSPHSLILDFILFPSTSITCPDWMPRSQSRCFHTGASVSCETICQQTHSPTHQAKDKHRVQSSQNLTAFHTGRLSKHTIGVSVHTDSCFLSIVTNEQWAWPDANKLCLSESRVDTVEDCVVGNYNKAPTLFEWMWEVERSGLSVSLLPHLLISSSSHLPPLRHVSFWH